MAIEISENECEKRMIRIHAEMGKRHFCGILAYGDESHSFFAVAHLLWSVETR